MDFVTGLPPSEGPTVILTIVDCFSKAAHFVSLPKPPSAAQTGELLVKPPPRDPLRHRLQSATAVYLSVVEGFLMAFGSSASLSSGHHHHSNGQSD